MSHHAMVDPISLLAMVIVTNWFLNTLFVSSQLVLRFNNPSSCSDFNTKQKHHNTKDTDKISMSYTTIKLRNAYLTIESMLDTETSSYEFLPLLLLLTHFSNII